MPTVVAVAATTAVSSVEADDDDRLLFISHLLTARSRVSA